MEDIRYVIDELNRAPFLKGYNLLAYDALRSDQRLDLLIELLNTIDPKLALPSIRGGSGVAIEDTVATILEQLRIFKFRVPFEYGSSSASDGGTGLGAGSDFRRDLLLGDKELHTFLLKWLFERAGALKKRAYLARFLVKIEVPPELEGDHDVVTLYQQYQRTIEEFKRSHAASETQKRALDALIELQRDIHSMEIERDQAKAKLETVKRRVDIASSPAASKLFEAARKWALTRAESDKLARQAQEQSDKMSEIKRQLEQSRAKLLEHRASNNNVEHITGNGLIEQLKDEITIQRRRVGTFLPAEFERLRSTVEDMETIAASGENEAVLKDYLSRIEKQIGVFETEIRQLLDRKLMTTTDDDDDTDTDSRKAVHYRRNAEAMAAKRERIQSQVSKTEAFLREEEHRLNQIRASILQNNQLGDMRGEALNVALERWTSRETEMQLREKELRQLEGEAKQLESKASELHGQDSSICRSIEEQEDQLSIGGYFSMKELTLLEQPVDNDPDGDGLEGIESESAASVEVLNSQITRLQSRIEKMRSQLGPLVRDVKQQKQLLNEMESEFGMKKRLYESAAAGLEADISLQERHLETASSQALSLNDSLQAQKAQLAISEAVRDWFVSDTQAIVNSVQQQLQNEQAELNFIRHKQESEADDETKRLQKSSQIEMWRNVNVLLEIKTRILQGQHDKNSTQTLADGTYNHLVL